MKVTQEMVGKRVLCSFKSDVVIEGKVISITEGGFVNLHLILVPGNMASSQWWPLDSVNIKEVLA